MSLRRCIYQDTSLCKRHGGSGASHHSSDYKHPLEHVPTLLSKGVVTETLDSLHVYVDEDTAHRALSVDLPMRAVYKSLFNFDLYTDEGRQAFLDILPVADAEIVKDVYSSIWPSSMGTKTVDTKLLKLQIVGYLHDLETTRSAGPVPEGDGAGRLETAVPEEQVLEG